MTWYGSKKEVFKPHKDHIVEHRNLSLVSKTKRWITNTLLGLPLAVGKQVKNVANGLSTVLLETPLAVGKILGGTKDAIADTFSKANSRNGFFHKLRGYVSATGRSLAMTSHGALELLKQPLDLVGGVKDVIGNTFKDVGESISHFASTKDPKVHNIGRFVRWTKGLRKEVAEKIKNMRGLKK